MNAAKKIRRFIEENQHPEQVQVLKDLAAALEIGRPFDLATLYQIDMRYFDVAIDLLKDWRFDHHIASRSRLLERLLTDQLPAAVDVAQTKTEAPATTDAEPATEAPKAAEVKKDEPAKASTPKAKTTKAAPAKATAKAAAPAPAKVEAEQATDKAPAKKPATTKASTSKAKKTVAS